jgi:hypothetical protein
VGKAATYGPGFGGGIEPAVGKAVGDTTIEVSHQPGGEARSFTGLD